VADGRMSGVQLIVSEDRLDRSSTIAADPVRTRT